MNYLLAQRTNNNHGIARAMYGIGYINMYYNKDETKALAFFKKGIEVAKKNNDSLNLSRCYKYCGIISTHQNIGNAYDLYIMALNYAKKTDDSKNLVDIYELISVYFRTNKKYKQAEKYNVLALEISKKYNIDNWFTGGLDYYELLMIQNKKSEAIAFAKVMNSFKNKLKKSRGEFIYLNDVGSLETKLKNYKEAERLFLKSLAIEQAKAKIDTFHLFFIFKNLENLYVEQGLYQKAYQVGQQFFETQLYLKEKRQTQDSKLQMTKIKAGLDIEKKEVEIALLETQKQQQLAILIAIIIIALLLVSFMVFLQRNRLKIQAQKEQLSELNGTKDKLFAVLSHDLRSPMASLKNYLMLINWGALSQDEFKDSIKSLSTQLNNVDNVLDNVLNWAISQMDGMKSKLEKVNIFNVVEEKKRFLQAIKNAKEIEIENQIPANFQILVDENHLRIIIGNLLQNALKFTNIGGKIVFSLKNEGGFSTIIITDNGVGIPQEKLTDLFVLGKGHSTLGTAQELGTGLGLVLVKELVELSGGQLMVSSEVGRGTTFSIKFKAV